MNQLDGGAQGSNPTLDRPRLPALQAKRDPTIAIPKGRQAQDAESNLVGRSRTGDGSASLSFPRKLAVNLQWIPCLPDRLYPIAE
jgi:hypothetical protein